MAKQTQRENGPAADEPVEAAQQPVDSSLGHEDLSQLRISQDFAAMAGGKELITTIPIRRPNRFEWIRVHEDPAQRIPLWTIADERDVYVVVNMLAQDLVGDAVPKMFYPAITRQGTLFLWPVRLPGPDGKIDTWNSTAAEAAERATKQWVRVAANMALGAYEIFEATGALPEPVWPNVTFDEMVKIAVKGRVVNTTDHPILRKLRGEL